MWKVFFEFCYAISYLIPTRKLRNAFRLNKLFDYKNKLNAIKRAYPNLNWKKMRLAKGGGSLAFIVDNTVFKVRKFHLTDKCLEKFEREKRITDAIAPILPIAVPHIELIWADDYLFYKTVFIPGRIMMDLPLKKILPHREKIGKQIGDVICILFNHNFPELKDLKPAKCDKNDYGLTHGDMCSNIVVNPDTMDVVGIIDWEYAGFTSLRREFFGIFRVRRKMRKTDIAPIAMWTYFEKCVLNKKSK
ncbi:MAG: hypothetical protein IKW57_04425 [Alphaproteobacteria bacterium]|nr:hypothetical protein [Alphaproteobacteria bacterium]